MRPWVVLGFTDGVLSIDWGSKEEDRSCVTSSPKKKRWDRNLSLISCLRDNIDNNEGVVVLVQCFEWCSKPMNRVLEWTFTSDYFGYKILWHSEIERSDILVHHRQRKFSTDEPHLSHAGLKQWFPSDTPSWMDTSSVVIHTLFGELLGSRSGRCLGRCRLIRCLGRLLLLYAGVRMFRGRGRLIKVPTHQPVSERLILVVS